jgi:hypothetical protein
MFFQQRGRAFVVGGVHGLMDGVVQKAVLFEPVAAGTVEWQGFGFGNVRAQEDG